MIISLGGVRLGAVPSGGPSPPTSIVLFTGILGSPFALGAFLLLGSPGVI